MNVPKISTIKSTPPALTETSFQTRNSAPISKAARQGIYFHNKNPII